MKIETNIKYKSFWLRYDGFIEVIDQTKLPFLYKTLELQNSEDVYNAIKNMKFDSVKV